jgi:release factor glutamine methyltransferase
MCASLSSLPVSPTPLDHLIPDVVGRLRSAGCVYAEEEADLLVAEAATPADLAALVEQRVTGVPLEHVLGWARFCGLRIGVDPGVFVPRHRSEFLARQATAAARRRSAPVVLDLCCGSGAVGAAVLAAVDRVELHAADIEPAAVRCAGRNLAGRGQVHQGDLFAALPAGLRGRIDVLVVNAPYVPSEAIGLLPPEARLHEPRVALDGGPDGLDVLRRVIAEAPGWLAPRGCLLVETSDRQAQVTVQAFARAGLVPRVVRSAGRDATVVIGTG